MIKKNILLIIALLVTQSIAVLSKEPWLNRDWLNLLLYEKINANSFHSLADGPSFFLTENGNHNPKSEYLAALELTQNQDKTFKNTFPLRYKRIAQWNNIPYEPIVNHDERVTSVRLAYPNRYMGNPASMFGHIFLIFNRDTGPLDSELFHFIANANQTAGASFVLGGISGQFKGRFLIEPFHKKIKEYTYEDDREVIYYDLNLTSDEIENLQLFAIDLKSTYFYYYFKDENCAFFIGKALNGVLNRDVVKNNLYVAPSDVINQLISYDQINRMKTRPTLNKQFITSYSKLNGKEKKAFIELISKKIFDVSDFSSATLKTFLYISEFILNNYPHLTDTIRYNRFQSYDVLTKRKHYPIRQNPIAYPVTPLLSQRLAIDYIGSQKIRFEWNPIYYDSHFEDFETKRVNILAPSIIRQEYDQFRTGLTILEISSIQAYNPIFGGMSWRTEHYATYLDQLGIDLSFDYGVGFLLSDQSFLSIFGGIRLSNYNQINGSYLNHQTIFPSLEILANHSLKSDTNIAVKYAYIYDQHYLTPSLHAKWRDVTFEIAHNFTYGSDDFTTFGLHYFY